jgi:hypothetical protein
MTLDDSVADIPPFKDNLAPNGTFYVVRDVRMGDHVEFVIGKILSRQEDQTSIVGYAGLSSQKTMAVRNDDGEHVLEQSDIRKYRVLLTARKRWGFA